MEELIKELRTKMKEAQSGGGAKEIEKQRSQGKKTAWERIDLLLDKGSFHAFDPFALSRCQDFGMDKRRFPGDGVITGSGRINGRLVFVAAQDFTVMGGTLGEVHANKFAACQDMAIKNRLPFIQILDSGGARIQEGVLALNGYGKIFRRNTLASGLIPQISIVVGPTAGGAVYSPGLTDIVFMVEGIGRMFITGPEVIRNVTGEEVTFEDLGGARVHSEISGVAHFSSPTEEECFALARKLLGFLPSNCYESPPALPFSGEPILQDEILEKIVPISSDEVYDIKEVITCVVDNNDFLEIQPTYALNAVVGLGRLAGKVVGIVATQPLYMAGVLDINSSDKIARFVRFCDAFNIPLINFVDVPGYLPGTDQEHGGIIRHGAKVLYAYSEATVPKISLILRKAIGGAYIALCSQGMGYDYILAYPTAYIAVMGAEGAVSILYRKEIQQAKDPTEYRKEREREFEEKFSNPYFSASTGLVNAIIEPRNTRQVLVRLLEDLWAKREERPPKKHGNPPF
jgi:acetyl-CoA carboxylase carboxyltransferase component